MKTQPWQRMRSWKGGWVEGVATELHVECGQCASAQVRCFHTRDDLLKRKRLRARLARNADGTCIPLGEVGVGGEENRVTYDSGGTPQVRMPKTLTLAWFLANGWEGSTVERRGIEVKLVHPSGAVMRLRATALEDVTC